MLTPFLVSAIFIALAELGDKTQLLALCLAARYRLWQVLVGIFFATLLVHLVSVLVGRAVGSIVPAAALRVVTGLLFIGFGVWTLRGDTADDADADRGARFGPVLATGVAFFLAELGDKTQIMTMTIAADPTAAVRSLGAVGERLPLATSITPTQAFVGVWLGSTVGMLVADGVAIVVGALLGRKLPERIITRLAGAIFIAFGLWTLAGLFVY